MRKEYVKRQKTNAGDKIVRITLIVRITMRKVNFFRPTVCPYVSLFNRFSDHFVNDEWHFLKERYRPWSKKASENCNV